MTVEEAKEIPDLNVRLQSGTSLVKVRPLFSHDSKYIIVASGSNVKVYSIQSGECIHTLRHHLQNVISLQENKNNKLQFLSCSEDGVVVRWDLTEGKLLQVFKLSNSVASFYAPSRQSTWYFTEYNSKKNRYNLYKAECYKKNESRKQNLFSNISSCENAVGFGSEGFFVAAIYENSLKIFVQETKTHIKHMTGDRQLTCVACHPTDLVVATGDNHGRVMLWSNLTIYREVIKSMYHWHTLPVVDVSFSIEGCYLYSGGGEACLVKWNLFSYEKQVIPRLGGLICRIVSSPDNTYVLIAQDDNCLKILNSQLYAVQVIQGLTQGHFQGSQDKTLLPTGLLYDPVRRSLIMNGKPGHLQFYDVIHDKHLFNLDIVGRNLITQESTKVIVNVDVHKAAIDQTGHWLATAESWNDEETSIQIWLKFWEFDLEKQTFVLNTNVILPHNKELNCIIFQPNVDQLFYPTVVTTSDDRRFKVWVLNGDDSTADKQSWTCENMGCYRNMAAGSASFSEEGSLLAVAFDNVATLWVVDTMQLKAVLHHEKNVDHVIQLHFGGQSSSHLLVSHNRTLITVWNVISLSTSWIVHAEVQTLVADISTDLFAAFCKDNSLIIFKPDDPEPVYFKENVHDKSVMAAIFVPISKVPSTNERLSFYHKSQLYFYDEEQKLLTLTDQSDVIEDIASHKPIPQSIPKTPFGSLQAEKKVTNVKAVPQGNMFVSHITSNELNELLSPTHMDPVAVCSELLKKLLIPASSTTKENKLKEEVDTFKIKPEKMNSSFVQNGKQKLFSSQSDEFGQCPQMDFTFLRDEFKPRPTAS